MGFNCFAEVGVSWETGYSLKDSQDNGTYLYLYDAETGKVATEPMFLPSNDSTEGFVKISAEGLTPGKKYVCKWYDTRGFWQDGFPAELLATSNMFTLLPYCAVRKTDVRQAPIIFRGKSDEYPTQNSIPATTVDWTPPRRKVTEPPRVYNARSNFGYRATRAIKTGKRVRFAGKAHVKLFRDH